MWSSYLKAIIRNYWKTNRFFTTLNLLGLSIGMAVSLYILLYVSHEYSFDRFHINADRIFLSTAKLSSSEAGSDYIKMSAKFGPAIKQINGNVEEVVRIKGGKRIIVRVQDGQNVFEERFIFADKNLFNVFSFKAIRGDLNLALSEPMTVVITDKIAHKYFGETNPIGKIIIYNNKHTLRITSVVEPPPLNSSLQFDFIGSFSSLATIERSEMGTFDDDEIPSEASYIGPGAFFTYFLLRPNSDPSKVENSISYIIEQSGRKNQTHTYRLLPLVDLHLSKLFPNSIDKKYIHILLIISFAIITLALLNYINLSTSLASKRAKEVGIRKVMGATKIELMSQFLLESFIMSIVSFVIAVGLVVVIDHTLKEQLQLQTNYSYLFSTKFLLITILFLVACGFVSGWYPSLLLSQFKPIDVLRDKLVSAISGTVVRNMLTLFQFVVSSSLIVCASVIWLQTNYMKSQNLGIYTNRVLVLPLDVMMSNKYNSLKSQLRQLAGVESVSSASVPLFKSYTNIYSMRAPLTNKEVSMCFMTIDENFPQTMRTQWLIAPKEYDLNQKNAIIVNEVALKMLNIEKNPLGQKVEIDDTYRIAGVIKDFHFTSLHKGIDGLVISVVKDTSSSIASWGGNLFIKFDRLSDLQSNVVAVKKIYDAEGFEKPYEYYFLDEALNALYQKESKLASIFTIFSCVAIFIACIGLFGLITYTIERRAKEIGIRKVLGASLFGIIQLLAKDFFKLVSISLLIAFPIAWYGLEVWLQNYPYRTNIHWSVFLVTSIVIILLISITIALHTIKISNLNPVKTLKK